MIVCHCQAVSDSRIRDEIECGARDVNEIGSACEAGTVCGGCEPMLRRLLTEHCHHAGVTMSGSSGELVGAGA